MAIYNLNDSQASDTTQLIITGGTTTSLTVSTTSVSLFNSSTDEHGAEYLLWNSGTINAYINFGSTATVAGASFPLNAGWMYQPENVPYKGQISGITESGTTTIRVTKFQVTEI